MSGGEGLEENDVVRSTKAEKSFTALRHSAGRATGSGFDSMAELEELEVRWRRGTKLEPRWTISELGDLILLAGKGGLLARFVQLSTGFVMLFCERVDGEMREA